MLYLITLWTGLLALVAALFFPLATLVVGAVGIAVVLLVDTSRGEADYGRIVLFVVHCGVVGFSLLMLLIHYLISLF